ncbi:MAG: hypothetical protein K9M97_11825 [Akkermansiaceae bacterium]|nr:hypothetical protein [Akkermansiaceae bacterium]
MREFNNLIRNGRGTKGELNALLDAFDKSGWKRTGGWARKALKKLPAIAVLVTLGGLAVNVAEGQDIGQAGMDVVMEVTNADLAEAAIMGLADPALKAIQERDSEMARQYEEITGEDFETGKRLERECCDP